MIQYTLEAALRSRRIEHVFITSDDEEILEFCRRFDVDCDYKRPPELAGDLTSMADTILHGLHWLADQKGIRPKHFVLLQPTSPLRTHVEIDEAIAHYLQSKAESLTTVHQMLEHPYNCVRMSDDGWDYLVEPENKVPRRQEWPSNFFFFNGAVYVRNYEAFLKEQYFVRKGHTVLFEIPRSRGVDINTIEHVYNAEALLRAGPAA